MELRSVDFKELATLPEGWALLNERSRAIKELKDGEAILKQKLADMDPEAPNWITKLREAKRHLDFVNAQILQTWRDYKNGRSV